MCLYVCRGAIFSSWKRIYVLNAINLFKKIKWDCENDILE